MSHLWIKKNDGPWIDYPLDSGLVQLAPDGPAPLVAREQLGMVSGPVIVRTPDVSGVERWALLCVPRSRTRVNGQPVAIGARMLADRDAIALGNGHTVWFSSERRPDVVPYPGEEASCIRCKLPLERGRPAVRCPAPGCGFWHHQSDDRPCWTYAERCTMCNYPTAFDAGFQWSPSVL